MHSPPSVAIVGATGLVGRELLALLEQRDFPLSSLRCFASTRSARERLRFAGRDLVVEALADDSLGGVDVAFFCAGPTLAGRARAAAAAGTFVVDDGGALSGDADVPVVVPEVNGALLEGRPHLVAAPGSLAVQLSLVLRPLQVAAGLKRVVVCTYQSASGAGREAMDELRDQAVALLSFRDPPVRRLPRRLAFDCLPETDERLSDGSTREEARLGAELRRVLDQASLAVGATCVRVPVFVGDAMAVHLELERALSPEAAREALAAAPGLRVADDEDVGPMAQDAADGDDVLIGRLRRDPSTPTGLALWCVADNVRRGAALNAVRIAEGLMQRGLSTH